MDEYDASVQDRHDGGRARSSILYAVLGAIVMTFFSWIPFAPVVGGALSGYLESGEPSSRRSANSRGLRVGGLAGLLGVIPSVLVVGIVGSVVIVGWLGMGFVQPIGPGGGMSPRLSLGLPILAWVLLAFGLLAFALYHVALGALGGWLGVQFADRSDRAVATGADESRHDAVGERHLETENGNGAASDHGGADGDAEYDEPAAHDDVRDP